MNDTRSLQSAACAELMILAERELAAFLSAITGLYGAEQARMSAEVWLDQLESMNSLPGPASRDWRAVTVAALARLASQMTAKKVLPIPSSDCSASTLLL